MMRSMLLLLLPLVFSLGCDDEELPFDPNYPYNIEWYDGTVTSPVGDINYRVYYPVEFYDQTYVIHISRGGTGLGDDRGGLLLYIEAIVQAGYVVVQIDHRFAGRDAENIARFRGQEIKFIASKITGGELSLGDFKGNIDPLKQGFLGHSAGCMEGLMAAGTQMTHGNYFVPEIKAVYGISPAGFLPDQFGISRNPIGYSAIDQTAIFLAIGEEEISINGVGRYMAPEWRLQPFRTMNENGPRFQAVLKGKNTTHSDMNSGNEGVLNYNRANAIALFDTYLKGLDRFDEIGMLKRPSTNEVDFDKKGL